MLDSLVSVARLDARAARDALSHPVVASALDDGPTDALHAVIAAAGLGTGVLSAHHHEALTGSVTHAEAELERLLRPNRIPARRGRPGSPAALPTLLGDVGVSAISCPQPL